MLIDERTEFCDATALNTGAAGTYLIGDVIDLGLLYGNTVGDNVGVTEELWLNINVAVTATSGGSATGQFHLCSDSTASIATNGTATYHFSTGAIPVASLTAGTNIARVRLPVGTYERYLGILQTTGTAAFTAGAVDAFLTPNVAAWTAKPDAI